MEEERKFTNREHLLGICQAVEVGMTWEDRWSKTDEFHGRCKPEQVGQSKKQSPDPAESDDDDPPLPDGTSFVFDHEIAAYRRDPTEYKARNPPALVVKLLAVDEDRRTRQLVAEASERRKRLDPRQLSSEELEARVLDLLGLTERPEP